MHEQDTIAVVGAGVIGAAVACALSREGHRVLLLDRAEPGFAGASFGNAGHIAAELVQPLPSPGLLFGFWRELFSRGGTLDLPAHQVRTHLRWMANFATAAFRRNENTRHLAPLVRPASATMARWLDEIGRPELIRRHGHYEIGLGHQGGVKIRAQARAMAQLGIRTETVMPERLLPLMRAAAADTAAGLWFPDSAHVVDPREIVGAFATAATQLGATFKRLNVQALRPRGDRIELISAEQTLVVKAAVVCGGIGCPSLLAPFGVNAPLQAVRGYHVEMPGSEPYFDAPVVHNGAHILVTPMNGRLRATSYMEFAEPGAPPDPRKPARLRQMLRALGYPCELEGSSWVGERPVLPDYLPGIGRAPGPAKLFYATGHQHIGLTMAPITAELVSDLVAERSPRLPIAAFDLKRFGAPHGEQKSKPAKMPDQQESFDREPT